MAKTDSTRVMWRVQTKAKTGRWINRGLYETRATARLTAALYRVYGDDVMSPNAVGYGYGRTRIVRHVRGGGR